MEVVQSTKTRLISSQRVILMYILEVEYLIHVLLISHDSQLQLYYDSRRLIKACSVFVVHCVFTIADPDAKFALFEHWVSPHVLSSTRIWYSTFQSGSDTVDAEPAPVFLKCDIHVYT